MSQSKGRREYLKSIGAFAAGLAIGGLAGWFSKPQEIVEVSKPETPTIVKKKITWWTVVNEGKIVSGQLVGNSPDFENAVINEFTKQYPEIEVEVTMIPWGELFTKYVTAFEAGTGPDVFFIPTTWAPQFIYSGYCKSLEDFKNELDLNDFLPSALSAFSAEGQLYGIPLRVDTRLLNYNKRLLREAGYDRAPAYWPDEVLEWSKALTKEEIGQYGIGIVGKATDSLLYEFWLCWVFTNGGAILSKDNKECVLNSPEAIEALEFYCDLLNKYKVAPPGALDYDKTALRTMFIAEKIGMFSDGKFAIVDYAKKPDLEYGLDLIPGTKKIRSAVVLGGWAVAMNSNTRYPEEAWKFMKFVSEPRWMATWSLSVPARYSAASYAGYFDDFPSKITFEQSKYAKPLPMHPKTGKMIPVIVQGVSEAVGGKRSPSEAMEWITSEINELLKE
ncbi:MAG: sugar ABC transporter substrate-binding protein [Candidatus Bathyarchaeia archaeon]